MKGANRLARESSPYLRQHQHNPVDWYPWGPEALARAKAEDRPILLSIGYSACHWCHVMERECFEDEAIAALMNRLFVNVKVDREERPDIDNIYQTAVQMLRKSGGWPLTAFLTPDGRPFFVGTYFPPTPRYGLPGFPQLLGQVQHAWSTRREEIDASSSSITAAMEQLRDTGPGEDIGSHATVQAAGEALLTRIDGVHGGFGTAPKFPSPTNLWTLWRLFRRHSEEAARDAVLLTLTRMADGGVYDQLAGGFHRYSTDREWLAPHFEKMLYDSALLVPLYLEAWRECSAGSGPREAAEDLLRIATETLDYLTREMRSPEGLFFSATDADSEGVEGRFFVWTEAGVRAVLAAEPEGAALAETFCRFYDVTTEGNWEGSSILRRRNELAHVAKGLGIEVDTLRERLAAARGPLLAARSSRVPPLRDEKVLVAWNALTIIAFVDGWRATGREDYARTAVEATEALLAQLVVEGRLLHSTCNGDRRGPGFLDDYAALGLALLHVHEMTSEAHHLEAARSLAIGLDAHYRDPSTAAWLQTPDDGEVLIQRPRDSHDSAVPCGSGLAAAFFARLAAFTDEERWRTGVETTLRGHAGLLEQNPFAAGTLLGVLDTLLGGWDEVVLAGDGPERAAMQRVLGTTPGLDRIVFHAEKLPPNHPAGGRATVQQPTAWVCRGRACSLPVTTAQALRELLTG